jgi:hypothetical protein
VSDFDGDDAVDVLGTEGQGSDSNDSFVWARNDGSGSFTILSNVPDGDGDFLQGVAAGRFTAGGPLEVALSWHVAGKGVQMLSVPADPSAQAWTWRRISATSQDEGLTMGDIDRDNDQDLLLGTKWLRNTGGTWSPFTLNPTSGDPDRNRLADVNRDGRLDAVVGFEAISIPGKLAWYEQPATATGTWTEHVIGNPVGPMSIDVGDLDGDGDIDVVVGEHNLAAPTSARLVIFENTDSAGGAWAEHVIYAGDEHHDGAQLVDIDNDGDLDVISIGWSHSRVVLYENKAIDSTPQVALPTIDPAGGVFSEPVTVTLATTTPGAEIRYTTDGSTPDQASTLYAGPFVLSATATVRARAFADGYTPSAIASASIVISTGSGDRVTAGLQVLYTFEEGQGTVVHDVSGVGSAMDLNIASAAAVTWVAGGLSVDSPTTITSPGAASKVIGACMASNEITIEGWVKPANVTQDGPARIVTLSADTYNRNFTLGQGLWGTQPKKLFDGRLRTTAVSDNGQPSVSTAVGTATVALTHVVYTRTAAGAVTIYVNDVQQGSGTIGGNLSNWNTGYRLGLANELTGDRPWSGELYLVAVYDRALSAAEVTQNFVAGPSPAAEHGPAIVQWESLVDYGAIGLLPVTIADGYVEGRSAGMRVLRVTFDGEIDPDSLGPDAVSMVGLAGGDVSSLIDDLSLDASRTVLTITLSAAPQNADTYTLTISDEVAGTGGNAVSGDLDIQVSALTGDVDGSGGVTAADLLAIRAAAGETVIAIPLPEDLDGSGMVTGADMLVARRFLGTHLP